LIKASIYVFEKRTPLGRHCDGFFSSDQHYRRGNFGCAFYRSDNFDYIPI
jgi:hypothetical protein